MNGTRETREISAKDFMEKVVPGSIWTPIKAESQLWNRMIKHQDFICHYYDIDYIVREAEIRNYFKGRGAPQLSGGAPIQVERFGKPVASDESVRVKLPHKADETKSEKPKPKDAHMPQIRRQRPEPSQAAEKEVVEPI